MKIGQFANKNNISIDTIRHYIDMGLIIPKKSGHLYKFDDRCKKDLDEIIKLKEMRFTLKEIKLIFILKRLGKMTKIQRQQWYKTFFQMKYNSIVENIDELIKVKSKLEEKLERLSVEEDENHSIIGVDFKSLSLLRCRKCNGEFILSDGNITNNKILNGVLKCSCNEELIVKDGILLSNSIVNKEYEEFSIIDYINNTKEEFLENMCTCMEWAYKNTDFKNIENKVVLELGSGFGFLIRTIYDELPENSIYILVDYDISRHRYLKKTLEKANCRKNLLFICSDFLEMPIKENSVDFVYDVVGTSYYCMENEDFLLKHIDKYIKDDAKLVGGYIIFDNFSEKSIIDERYRHNFIIDNIDKRLNELNYKEINSSTLSAVEELGEYEDYCSDGERLYNYLSSREKIIK